MDLQSLLGNKALLVQLSKEYALLKKSGGGPAGWLSFMAGLLAAMHAFYFACFAACS